MKILILYEMVPEAIQLYAIETDDPPTICKLRACHGKFAGTTDCPPEVETTIGQVEALGELLFDSTEESRPLMLPGSTLIHTGIML